MNAPERIQLRRTKGWRKPENTVVVARPSKWGNPFTPSNEAPEFWYVRGWGRRFGCVRSEDDAVRLAVDLFRNVFERRTGFGLPDPSELRGKNLACWCPLSQPCHADVLLELANPPIAATDPHVAAQVTDPTVELPPAPIGSVATDCEWRMP